MGAPQAREYLRKFYRRHTRGHEWRWSESAGDVVNRLLRDAVAVWLVGAGIFFDPGNV